MSIVNRIKDVARYRDQNSIMHLKEDIAVAVAGHLPRMVKVQAVVQATNAAVRIREEDPRTACGYWGPDGVSYEMQHDALNGINTLAKNWDRQAKDAATPTRYRDPIADTNKAIDDIYRRNGLSKGGQA